jgi:translation initiation factor IF-2
MPVRIYDIAKKLGIESKEVLAKAKELGITGARVPSSSLDKITAAYLEEQFVGSLPVPAEPAPAPPAPPPVIILTAPAPPPPATEPLTPESVAAPETVPAPPTELGAPVSPVVEAPALAPVVAPLPASPVVPEAPPVMPLPPPPPPLEPPVPRLGELVGRIQLPQKPAPRPAPGKPQLKPGPPQRPGRPAAPGSPAVGARPGARPTDREARPAAPVAPRIVLPATAGVITLKPPIVVRDLAEQLKRKPFQLIADLMELGVFATVNQAIDEPIAQRLCAKHGFRFELEKRNKLSEAMVHAPPKPVELDTEDKPEQLTLRAPVVTIMGHVDHGKTSLLDVVRKSNVAAKEAGGITQHIGAYTISIPHPERKKELQQITFLDTPGHAAFSAMRARGANVTDLVVLVVAANDGVMPQTLEALSHAQAAKVQIIVAVNKCDHPNANPMKVRQQLQDKGLVCEEWGGNTIFVDVSALTRQGVDKLLEMIVLQAEVMELKANPNRTAKGNVIESGLEPGGPMATVLVRKGTLRVGDTVICGQNHGRVRALVNEEGKRLKEAGPSVAVKLLGLNGVPEAGIEFSVVANEKDARLLAEERAESARALDKEQRPKASLEDAFWGKFDEDSKKTLRVIVKADTQGSVEAIVDALKKIESDKVSLEIAHSAVGTITETDIILASASEAVVLGFHTRIDSGVSDVAKREGVQIKLYAIIYELIDQVKDAMAGLLDPTLKDVVTGAAEVRKLFTLSKGGNVAGCVVASGRIGKGKVRVMRRKNEVFQGLIFSLRRFQDEVNEVRAGMECGIRLDGFNEFQVGDTIESFTVEKVPQKL